MRAYPVRRSVGPTTIWLRGTIARTPTPDKTTLRLSARSLCGILPVCASDTAWCIGHEKRPALGRQQKGDHMQGNRGVRTDRDGAALANSVPADGTGALDVWLVVRTLSTESRNRLNPLFFRQWAATLK